MILIPAKEVPQEYWPAILFERHRDYIWPFSYVQRSSTAYFGEPPHKVEGNAIEHNFWYRQIYPGVWRPCLETDDGAILWHHPRPIPDRGEWWRGIPSYYASQSVDGWLYRNGYRWDDVDGYYQWPSFKIGKYNYP